MVFFYKGQFDDFMWFLDKYLELKEQFPQTYVLIQNKQVIAAEKDRRNIPEIKKAMLRYLT